MTVKELIEKLSKLPQDLPVYLGDWNEQWADDSPLEGDPRIKETIKMSWHNEEYTIPRRVLLGESNRDR